VHPEYKHGEGNNYTRDEKAFQWRGTFYIVSFGSMYFFIHYFIVTVTHQSINLVGCAFASKYQCYSIISFDD
jgi:hypothetical protein